MMKLGFADGADLDILTRPELVGNVPELDIDWRYTDLTGQYDVENGFNVTFEDATIAALVISKIPELETGVLLALGGFCVALKQRRKRKQNEKDLACQQS